MPRKQSDVSDPSDNVGTFCTEYLKTILVSL